MTHENDETLAVADVNWLKRVTNPKQICIGRGILYLFLSAYCSLH